MSENMEEIIANIMANNASQGQPVSEDDKVAIDNFKYGYTEGSYGEICEKFDVQQNDDGPVFGPTD